MLYNSSWQKTEKYEKGSVLSSSWNNTENKMKKVLLAANKMSDRESEALVDSFGFYVSFNSSQSYEW